MSGDIDRRTVISVAAALIVVIAIVVGGIAVAGGGGEDEGATTTPTTTPAPSEAPGGSAAPGDLSRFPPEFIQCLQDRAIDVEGKDPNELFHGGAVPPQVLNECFGALHGAGAP